MELVKFEAFDHWIDGKLGDKKRKENKQITTNILLKIVTAKLGRTFRNLKTTLHQVTLERDELQYKT